jgi:N-acetylglucosaminyldiphosphoundecaprenol N-acetyl-beta-D-mannosaminyltransferase
MATSPQIAAGLQGSNQERGQRRIHVGPVAVADYTAAEATEAVLGRLRSGRGARIATANLDFIALARKDAHLREDLLSSDLVIADGMPVVWLARLAGARRVQRLPGVDLVERICRAAGSESELRIALYGSTAEIASRAIPVLEAMGPRVRVVASIQPPFRALSDAEREENLAALGKARPNMVLVALGCPRQERAIAEWYPAMPEAVWIGVGGTLDFFAGERKRAPAWIQRLGLEWLVRMAQEPGRLAGRYLGRDLPVLVALGVRCAIRRPGVPASD